jgi:anti-sigma regulatory factor (Ser/Thr protein kinase)
MAEMANLGGFGLKDRDKICLAVDEACSNIIRHSYEGKTDGEIIIKCTVDTDSMTISIRDFGQKFDVSKVKPRNPETAGPGGLGIHMMRNIMDRLDYDCSHECGTELRMVKYLRAREAGDES